MPHQCVKCSTFFSDGSEEIIKGCPCGGKLFFYIKPEKYAELKGADMLDLSSEDKKQIEKDVYDILGMEHDAPVVLDFESIRVLKPGQYELDLVSLFKGEPVVFKLDEGRYVIDVAATFKKQLDKEG